MRRGGSGIVSLWLAILMIVATGAGGRRVPSGVPGLTPPGEAPEAAGQGAAETMGQGDAEAAGQGAAEAAVVAAQDEAGTLPMNGITVSTPRGSSLWGGDDMLSTLDDLAALGASWVAIHPYARVDRDGSVRWRRRERRTGGQPAGAREAPIWLRRPIEEAHRRGLKILIKPHLAYWGAWEWRGEIAFESAGAWDRFFTSYEAWIAELAAFSHDADAFVVGTELEATVHHEEAWRRIVDRVRQQHPGPLTWAANWDGYRRVGFWDALDWVGIQAYFPLIHEARGRGEPTAAEIERGWARIMEEVRAFAAATGRPVVFTELGYNASPVAAHEPWNYDVRAEPGAEALQIRCMRAALRAVAAEPSVLGAFLWKWFPGDRTPRDFALSTPAMRRVISEHWLPDPVPGR